MIRLKHVTLGLFLLIGTGVAEAHVVSIEPQALDEHPWQSAPADDYAFDAPRVLDNVWGSKAIFGYLDAEDVDVYEFTLAPEDIGYPGSVVSVIALTPACNQTKNRYLNVALIGPPGPGVMSGQHLIPAPAPKLPVAVPPGMGVYVAENPVLPDGLEREIFDEETVNVSWFLPDGLTQQCIMTNPFTCDWSNTVYDMYVTPGTYYIVVWDPDGVKQDYTLSIGFVDAGYYEWTPEEELVRDDALLHGPCSEPYASAE